MPTHAERKILPYTAVQLYELVADVESYPQFLPWCKACRIKRTEKQNRIKFADLTIGYKMFQEKFGSKVLLSPYSNIRVEYLDGPLKHLSNQWVFIQNGDGSCTIDFYVDFEFHNPFLKQIVNLFFNEAVKRMVSAFEDRARQLYGAGQVTPAIIPTIVER